MLHSQNKTWKAALRPLGLLKVDPRSHVKLASELTEASSLTFQTQDAKLSANSEDVSSYLEIRVGPRGSSASSDKWGIPVGGSTLTLLPEAQAGSGEGAWM